MRNSASVGEIGSMVSTPFLPAVPSSRHSSYLPLAKVGVRHTRMNGPKIDDAVTGVASWGRCRHPDRLRVQQVRAAPITPAAEPHKNHVRGCALPENQSETAGL